MSLAITVSCEQLKFNDSSPNARDDSSPDNLSAVHRVRQKAQAKAGWPGKPSGEKCRNEKLL